ncbi:MAG: cysteine synthase A [Spirochaetaceae bacterium]|nr:cysteine synthase A [Spirochaetaceae bacterium]
MAKFYSSVDELIGNTPIIQLNRFSKDKNLYANIFAKLEYFNPTGSVKDRVAKALIDSAEERGLLQPDSVIIEPTSGNTGIGLAAVGVSRGYRVIIVMPDTMSKERRQLMLAYGAELVLTPGKDGMKGSIQKAKQLAQEIPHSYIPDQFENMDNPKIHYLTTGPEIWEAMDGTLDIFVAGIGTGGTISGVSRFLKENNPKINVIGVEPQDSPVLSGGVAGSHKLQGIGAGFIPKTLNVKCIDKIVTVTTEQAYSMAKEIALKEGIFVGVSSGAALWAATEEAKRAENQGKKIVVILPDTGIRYLSTPDFIG